MQKVRKTDATDIITLKNAFHGRTLGTVAATGQPASPDGFAPMPGGWMYLSSRPLLARLDSEDWDIIVRLEDLTGA